MTTLAAQATARDALWYTRCPVPTALGIAVHRGWFDEEFGPDQMWRAALSCRQQVAR